MSTHLMWQIDPSWHYYRPFWGLTASSAGLAIKCLLLIFSTWRWWLMHANPLSATTRSPVAPRNYCILVPRFYSHFLCNIIFPVFEAFPAPMQHDQANGYIPLLMMAAQTTLGRSTTMVQYFSVLPRRESWLLRHIFSLQPNRSTLS